MKDTTKDKVLLSLLGVSLILVIAAIIFAIVEKDYSNPTNEPFSFNCGRVIKLPPLKIEKTEKTALFFTKDNNLIIPDPSAQLARITYTLPKLKLQKQAPDPEDGLDHKHDDDSGDEHEDNFYNTDKIWLTPLQRDRNRIRPPNPFKFSSKSEIQMALNDIQNANKYKYQTKYWEVEYLWFKDITHCLPRFSVVMSVFNQETIINSNIISILRNMKDPFELIVVLDACTDQTKSNILNLLFELLERTQNSIVNDTKNAKENPKQKHVHFVPDNEQLSMGDCCCIIVIDTVQSVFETQCNNIGFKLSSAPNIIEVQAHMTMNQYGFNLTLEKPLLYYNDFISISGHGCHGLHGSNCVGCVDDVSLTSSSVSQWQDDRFCYVSATVVRGPLLFDAEKLKEMNYLNDAQFARDCDETDLFFRSWKRKGYRTGYIHIEFQYSNEDTPGAKQSISHDRSVILHDRRNGKEYMTKKYAEMISTTYRVLDEDSIIRQPKEIHTFGDVIPNTCLVQFGNIDTIYYHNAMLANIAHIRYGMNFENIRLYNEHHVKDFLSKLPSDVHKSKRGFCYWAWKPYIILDAMMKSNPNDIIIYADSGLYLREKDKILQFIKDAQKKSFVFFDLWHSNIQYCKPECLYLFNDEKDLEHSMTDASLFFVKNTLQMQSLIQEWISLCQTPYLLSDEPNSQVRSNLPSRFKHSLYVEHRHDQLLLSSLLRNKKYETSGIDPQSSNTITVHHRLRTYDQFIAFWTELGLSKEVVKVLDKRH